MQIVVTKYKLVFSLLPCLDQLISALDQDAGVERLPVAEAADFRTGAAETEQGQTAADSRPKRVLSRRKRTGSPSHRKKSTRGRVPGKPLVCVPCKKYFTRQRTMDEHRRLVHDAEVTDSCDDGHEPFSCQDQKVKHMKRGKCQAHSRQLAADTELSMVIGDGSQLHGEPSMLIYAVKFRIFAYLSSINCVYVD